MQNYESEFSKVESIAQVLTQMINEYKEKLQAKLSENMVKERNQVNLHLREIRDKKVEVLEIREGIIEVDEEIKRIKDNEGEYLRLQMELQMQLQEQQMEDEVCQKQLLEKNPVSEKKNFVLSGMNQQTSCQKEMIKGQSMQ